MKGVPIRRTVPKHWQQLCQQISKVVVYIRCSLKLLYTKQIFDCWLTSSNLLLWLWFTCKHVYSYSVLITMIILWNAHRLIKTYGVCVRSIHRRPLPILTMARRKKRIIEAYTNDVLLLQSPSMHALALTLIKLFNLSIKWASLINIWMKKI